MPRQEDDMKVITTNRLNRFWKNGVLPIKNSLANKLNTSSVVNNLLTTAAGYALDARQGKALDDKITALNGKLGYATSATTVTRGSWTVKYRNAGAGYMYVEISRTIAGGLSDVSAYTEITNLPFTAAFEQSLPITNMVANAVVGGGRAVITGATLKCQYEKYGASVTNVIAGLLRVA